MFVLLYIVISSTLILTSGSDGCGAGPLMYGPECTATDCLTGGEMIAYKIDEIPESTNLECMGWAWREFPSCKGGKFGWFPLGIMKEGDASTLYWGPNMGCPKIKCKGQPLPTTFTWSWYMVGPENSCCGDTPYEYKKDELNCCGETLYDPRVKECCHGIVIDPKINQCCEGYDYHIMKYVHTICKKDDDCCYGAYCCPNRCHINGVDCSDYISLI